VLCPRENLSALQHVDAFLVAAVHRGTDLCWPEARRATLPRAIFPSLLLLDDILDDLSVNRVPYGHGEPICFLGEETACRHKEAGRTAL
jgi:hypothetical protein